MKKLLYIIGISLPLAAGEGSSATTTTTTTTTTAGAMTVVTASNHYGYTSVIYNSLIHEGMEPTAALAVAVQWHPPMEWPHYTGVADLPEKKDNTK